MSMPRSPRGVCSITFGTEQIVWGHNGAGTRLPAEGVGIKWMGIRWRCHVNLPDSSDRSRQVEVSTKPTSTHSRASLESSVRYMPFWQRRSPALSASHDSTA